MEAQNRWIHLDGAVNVRDLGGLPTADGLTTRFGRVLRADNLQDLTPTDVRRLTRDLRLRHVVDLRSDSEVRLEGKGPLTQESHVTIHHLSLFTEVGIDAAATAIDVTIDFDKVLPWQTRRSGGSEIDRALNFYLGYLTDRPDSIISALRVVSRGEGATLLHCAAGKDRTGVVCAIALEVVGVTREAIVADYAQTGERIERLLARLRMSPTYAADMESRPDESHVPHAYIMEKFLSVVDERFGGTFGWLGQHGWTDADTDAMHTCLLGDAA